MVCMGVFRCVGVVSTLISVRARTRTLLTRSDFHFSVRVARAVKMRDGSGTGAGRERAARRVGARGEGVLCVSLSGLHSGGFEY